ncbi:glutathione S-transferase family protein [Aurantivibrio infirmus]
MSKIALYAFPGSCSKVSLILLEEAQSDFSLKLVRLDKGEHKKLNFRKINAKCKVPVLVVDGVKLTENPAIITYISYLFPEANLLPLADSKVEELAQLSDLCFCSATLHPMVTRICKPEFFVERKSIFSVKQKASEAMDEGFSLIEEHLVDGPWWYGESWSAMDAYIYWVFTRVQSCGFDVNRFPRFIDHANRMKQRPAVQRAIAKEAAMLEKIHQ